MVISSSADQRPSAVNPHGKAEQPTPERIMRLAWAFAPPLVIHAAIENGVFDSLDRSAKTPKELAADTGASERGIAAIMGALLAFELVTKQPDGRYHLAPDTASFLVRSKPLFYGGLIAHIQSVLLPNWLKLSEIARSGKPTTAVDDVGVGGEFFEQLVDALFPLNYPPARTLAQAMEAQRAANPSKETVKVLDVAAGSGVWGLAQAQESPRVRVTALDLEPVLTITRRNVERMGLTPRFEFLAGDMRTTSFGVGYSLVLLGHILHSEGTAQARMLLERSFEALAPGGTVAIAEFLVNHERTGPPMGLLFAVNMLVHTAEGNTFSFEEIQSWMKKIGFEKIRTLNAPGPSPLILAEKPAS